MAIINFILLSKSKDLPRKVVQMSPFVNHMKLITGNAKCGVEVTPRIKTYSTM